METRWREVRNRLIAPPNEWETAWDQTLDTFTTLRMKAIASDQSVEAFSIPNCALAAPVVYCAKFSARPELTTEISAWLGDRTAFTRTGRGAAILAIVSRMYELMYEVRTVGLWKQPNLACAATSCPAILRIQ